MGKSATGKDTIYKRLLEDTDLGLEVIVPYTTRPIRASEEEGREYHFVSEKKYLELKDSDMILEERSYDTVLGTWRYFTVREDGVSDADRRFLLIGTLETYVSLCDKIGKNNILPVYIDVDDGVRLERALRRERKQDEPKYAEMCRRFLADAEDFSEEKLMAAGVNVRFDNSDLDTCLENIQTYITERT